MHVISKSNSLHMVNVKSKQAKWVPKIIKPAEVSEKKNKLVMLWQVTETFTRYWQRDWHIFIQGSPATTRLSAPCNLSLYRRCTIINIQISYQNTQKKLKIQLTRPLSKTYKSNACLSRTKFRVTKWKKIMFFICISQSILHGPIRIALGRFIWDQTMTLLSAAMLLYLGLL